MVKLHFLHSLVINTFKFVLKNLQISYSSFVAVCRTGLYDVEVVVLQIFAMVHTRGRQVYVLVPDWLLVVVQWFTWGGCEIYSLVPAKKFVKFMVWYGQNMHMTSPWHELLQKPIKLQLPHLMDQFDTATNFITADILNTNFNVFNNPSML